MCASKYLLGLALAAASCTPAAFQTGVPVAASSPTCNAAGVQGVDSDRDGLVDECELRLARHFAPSLNVSSTACNFAGSASEARLGGGYQFAVQPTGTDTVRIAYMPAYYQDCGWTGPKCALPGVDCAPHAGDSEFIVVEVIEVADGRKVSGVFLLAHCFGSSPSSCRWYRGDALRQFDWDGGPVIWVAQGRNANYPSEQRCDKGHWWVDSCDGERTTYRFPIIAESNIGSRARPGSVDGCIPSAVVDPRFLYTDRETVECFWSRDPFKGWQRSGSGVTAYNRYLSEIARM